MLLLIQLLYCTIEICLQGFILLNVSCIYDTSNLSLLYHQRNNIVISLLVSPGDTSERKWNFPLSNGSLHYLYQLRPCSHISLLLHRRDAPRSSKQSYLLM